MDEELRAWIRGRCGALWCERWPHRVYERSEQTAEMADEDVFEMSQFERGYPGKDVIYRQCTASQRLINYFPDHHLFFNRAASSASQTTRTYLLYTSPTLSIPILLVRRCLIPAGPRHSPITRRPHPIVLFLLIIIIFPSSTTTSTMTTYNILSLSAHIRSRRQG